MGSNFAEEKIVKRFEQVVDNRGGGRCVNCKRRLTTHHHKYCDKCYKLLNGRKHGKND
jgi:hypothetical protein